MMNIKRHFKIIGFALLFFSLSPLKAFAHNPNAARPAEDGKLLQQYTWIEIMNPLLLIALVLVFVGYLWMMRKVSSKHEVKQKGWKKVAFLSGLLMIYLSLAGPVSIYSNNLLFSAHMTQQALMYIVMPFLILLGMPRVFYDFLHEKVFKYKVARICLSPLISILLFNVLLSFFHIPSIYEYALQNFIVLEIAHVVINSTAFLMWLHVLAPSGLINKMSDLMKIGYMFLNGLLLTPACALIIYSNDVLYPSIYESADIAFTTPLDDQKLGGIVLQAAQQLIYGMTISYIFFKWAKQERGKDGQVDPLPKIRYDHDAGQP